MTIINSQLGGTTPTGTKSITSNGVHDVAAYEYADVDVPTTAPAYYIEKTKDANGVAQQGSYLMDFSDFTDVGDYVFNYVYSNNTGITGAVDFGSLTTVSGNNGCNYMFAGCTGLTSIDLSSLTTVSASNGCSNMFNGCIGLTSIDLSSLTTVSAGNGCGSMFMKCTGIISVDLSSLTSVSGNNGCSGMFQNCAGITSVDLSSLTTISGNNGCSGMFNGCTNLASIDISKLAKLGTSSNISRMFQNCTSLTELRFNNLAYTTTNINSAFSNTLQGVTGCTVHFPSDWQTDMASYSNIINGLGGTNTTVLFDLPAVTTLDLSKVIDIDTAVFNSFDNYNYFPNITSVDLSSLTTVSGSNGCFQMFSGCTGLTSIDLSSLTTISGSNGCKTMFNGCTGLTSVDLSSLTTVSGNSGCNYMFQNCSLITSVDLSSLTTVGENGCTQMFSNCTGLTTLSFPSLKTVLNNQVFIGMLQGVTGCIVHFPSNLSSYNFNVGGSNTVLYDLPPTA